MIMGPALPTRTSTPATSRPRSFVARSATLAIEAEVGDGPRRAAHVEVAGRNPPVPGSAWRSIMADDLAADDEGADVLAGALGDEALD